MKSNRACLIVTLATLAVVATTGCRDARKTTLVGGKTASIIVTMQGLTAEDQANTSLLFEMSGCGSETVSGTPNAGSAPLTVTFATTGVKPGQECAFNVKQPSATTDQRFKWLDVAGLMYKAAKTPISQTTGGQLQSTAYLQRVYSIAQAQTYQVTADVVFPAANPFEGRKVITAQLFCDPVTSFTSIGVFTVATPTTGTVRFVEGIAPTDRKELSCSHFDLFADGLPLYRGTLAGTAGRFTATINGQIKLGSAPVAVTNLRWSSDNGRIGISTEAGSCPTPMIFDLRTRTCVCPTGTQLDPRTNQCF